jgi:hypothetical protein
MIFPNISLHDWMKKFPGLEPQEAECSCGNKGSTIIPVITKNWVGLSMPKCTRCGDETPGLIFKGRTPQIQKEMNSIFGV